MSSGRVSMAVLLLALMCAQALAAPCIECKDCRDNNYCLSKCQRSCPKPQPTVNGEKCKRFGHEAGWKAAREACETTLLFCNGGVKQQAQALGKFFPVSLGQCANIAYGTCQEVALNPWKSPCGYAFRGFKQCDQSTFNSFYSGVVNDRCNQAVRWIDQKGGSKH